jgi:hypothetical protein
LPNEPLQQKDLRVRRRELEDRQLLVKEFLNFTLVETINTKTVASSKLDDALFDFSPAVRREV